MLFMSSNMSRSRCLTNGVRLGMFAFLLSALSGQAYDQQWRPQYHFSRECCNVGDPAGFIRYNGVYRLFLWDQVQSTDLVHWSNAGWPLMNVPTNLSPWNGTVAVDLNNTSGFGTPAHPPMLAVWTALDIQTLEENVELSYSTDFINFEYYTNNPIVDGDVDSFRDPDLIWHEDSGKWVFAIGRAEESKIAFHSSTNLRDWVWTSDFGPLGANGFWEVPGLVELPINGDPGNKKWVLYTGRGPAQVQYFVGDFDGNSFTLDPSCEAYIRQGKGLDGILFEDFEADTWAETGWTTTGFGFGSGPASSGRAYIGNRCARAFVGELDPIATLTSPSFTIAKNCINFLIAGDDNGGKTRIELLINDAVVRSYVGTGYDLMKWGGWNVAEYKGQTAQLKIFNDFNGQHLFVDHIMFSDVLMNFVREHANWMDFGWDFYAARVMRDYDGQNECPVWIAWMCNWDYATNVPVSFLSIPRNLQLVSSPKGYEIQQQPLPALEQLRGQPVKVAARIIDGVVPLDEFQPAENVYEIEAVFNLPHDESNDHIFGLNLYVGPTNKVVVGYAAKTSNLYLDRSQSGLVDFHPRFPGTVTSPLPAPEGYIKFRIFVDKSSIEIFMNDGLVAQSALIYPDAASVGVELFSVNSPVSLQKLTAWPLSSIW